MRIQLFHTSLNRRDGQLVGQDLRHFYGNGLWLDTKRNLWSERHDCRGLGNGLKE